MWKKEDSKIPASPEISTGPANAYPTAPLGPAPISNSSREIAAATPTALRSGASISQGIRIKGEVTGTEDLFVDGHVEGKLDLGNASLTIGPNGRVQADVTAREVIVRGSVEGKVSGRERVQLWNTGRVTGEVQTERLAIEDGAVLRGKVEAGKVQTKAADARPAAPAAKPAESLAARSGSAAN